MKCKHCLAENPDQYNFCGICGKPLLRPAEVSCPEPVRATISGPSFLGLADTTAETETDWRQDEPASGHRGWIAFSIIALALLAGIGFVEWRSMHGQSLFPGWATKTGRSAANPTTPSQPAVPSPATDHTATAQTPQPGSASSSQGSVSNQKNWGAISRPSSDPAPDERQQDLQATQDAESRQAREFHENESKPREIGNAATNADESGTAEGDSTQANTASMTGKRDAVAVSADAPKNRMLQLGEKYLYGQGVARNCPQAVVYFKAAAEQGNAPAMLHLGAIYASGACLRQNRVAAFQWFQKAQSADPHDPWIAKNMDMVLRDMSPQERAQLPR